MSRVLVIGFGNLLRGDDAIGRMAADRLAATWLDADLEIRSVHQLTPDLAWDMCQADVVLFLDARSGGIPGSISVEKVEVEANRPLASMHALGPRDLMASARLLYGVVPETWMITATGERFEHGEDLSPRARAALDFLLRTVETFITESLRVQRRA